MLEYMQQLSYPLDLIYYDLLERCIKKEKILNAAQTHLIQNLCTDISVNVCYTRVSLTKPDISK